MIPQVASRATPGISKGTRPKSQLVTPSDPDSEFAYRRVVSHPSPHPTAVLWSRPLPPWELLSSTLSTIPASHAARQSVTLAPSLDHDAALLVLSITARTLVPLGTWPGSYLLRANGGAFLYLALHPRLHSTAPPLQPASPTKATACAITMGDHSSLPAIPNSTRTHNTPTPLQSDPQPPPLQGGCPITTSQAK